MRFSWKNSLSKRCSLLILHIFRIEMDSHADCLTELDNVQCEADKQVIVQCPTPFWSGS